MSSIYAIGRGITSKYYVQQSTDNSVIGANTCITQGKKIPDNCLVYGNPAHIIRNLRDDEIEALMESTEKYYRLGQEYKEQYDKL